MPGAKQGISFEDPTIAELLEPHGYVTAQFGKNHLGDRNEYLPTVHGFDEYAGVLYHLNAFEEPEDPNYPKSPEFFANFGPRDVLHTWATDKYDDTVDPRFVVVPALKFVGDFMASFKEFPPGNKPAIFSVGDALKSLETASQH